MGNHIKRIDLSQRQRETLEGIVRKASSPQNLVLRSKIILNTADGEAVEKICQTLQTTRATVSKWKHRFLEHGLDGLRDGERTGHPVKYGTQIRMRIESVACNPPNGNVRWTIRKLANYLDVDRGIVQRVLKGKR